LTPTHHLPLRVYYEDTDFSGIVYHASYLRFMERGRTEFLRSSGLMQRDLHAGPGGFTFVVRRMTIDWLKPAVMDDEIVVETSVSDVRGASMVMKQTVTRGGEKLVTGEVMVVGVRDGKPARLPAEVRSALMAVIATGPDQNGSGPLPE
jgi:acyl-CoA thioester hydrolase